MIKALTDHEDSLKKIANCLVGGECISSQFDRPYEEELHKDMDQSDDDSSLRDYQVCSPIENKGYIRKIISDGAKKNRFVYFLDGSLRTAYLSEYCADGLSFPILASEISVCIVKLNDKKVSPCLFDKKLFFIFPSKDTNCITDDRYQKLKELQKNLNESNSLIRIDFLDKNNLKGDIGYSMQGKARRLMHDQEHELAEKLERKDGEWLIMDGALRESKFLKLKNTIGLAKSFSRLYAFKLESSTKPISIASYLRNIGDKERSVVFRREYKKKDNDGGVHEDEIAKKTGFWFLRLRCPPPTMEPLGGIVKIDIRNDEDLTTEEQINLIDSISTDLYSLKFPSVYPWPRWPNYIYPIRLSEQYMGSSFLNKGLMSYMGKVIQNAIGTN